MATELETALADARRAGDGGPIDGFVAQVADRIGAHATVKAVFGEPIERDGLTIIPVAKVRWGFGGGAGSGPTTITATTGEPGDATQGEAGSGGSGQGGGGAVTADPVGWLEIGPDGTEFRPIVPPMPSPGFMLAAGATAALVLRGLAKLLRK